MEEGEIIQWLKKEGDKVKEGEPLLEVATDKAIIEVEALTSGFLRKIIISEGEVVPVTQTIAFIADNMEEEIPEGEEGVAGVGEGEKGAVKGVIKEVSKEKEGKKREEKKGISKEGEISIKASPLAKKLAKEYKIALATIQGTGPGGRILKEDVLREVEQKAVEQRQVPQKKEISLSKAEKVMIQRMEKSKREIPHFYLTMEVDFSEAMKIRDELLVKFEKEKGIHLTYTDLVIKSCGRALKKIPRLNSTFEEGKVISHSKIDVGLAVAREEGLIVPVIRDVNEKDLFQIAGDRNELVRKANENKLSLEELEGASFTLSNLGMLGIKGFTAIINPPQVSILAVGEIRKRAVVLGEKIEVRAMMEMTLSCDHRVVDGYLGARFLQEIKRGLEKPEVLCLPDWWKRSGLPPIKRTVS